MSIIDLPLCSMAGGSVIATNTVLSRTKFLTIIETQLKTVGYEYTRIDGSMTPKARDRAMEALQDDPDCRIMLASLAVCSVGLNLVAADTVILSDSCKHPRIKFERPFLLTLEQRVGPCHRRPGRGPCPSPRPDSANNSLEIGHGGLSRRARPGHPSGEAHACWQGFPGEDQRQEDERDTNGGHHEASRLSVVALYGRIRSGSGRDLLHT